MMVFFSKKIGFGGLRIEPKFNLEGTSYLKKKLLYVMDRRFQLSGSSSLAT